MSPLGNKLESIERERIAKTLYSSVTSGRTASTLVLFGGAPAVRDALPTYPAIGDEELAAVTAVMRSGMLSGFVGVWGPEFYGGPAVVALESAWCRTFGSAHAVGVNSATSALFAAVGAAGIGPGDEVIVPPYTMSATVMAPLMYGAIPVFVDIDAATFCLDPRLVRAAVTPLTKAIIAVNLFGHPAHLHELRALADERGLTLIEDNSQSPLAAEFDRRAGTIGHIGVFSLNRHKHVHAGEGGVCVTDDETLALRLAMIRNHGENAAEPSGTDDLTNLVGANYRLTELSAAIATVQLTHIEHHIAQREALAAALTDGVRDLAGITPPAVRSGCRHVSYLWAMRYDADTVGVSRETFVRALAAEGFPCRAGYVAPLYRLPLFKRRIAIGAHGYPFTLSDRVYTDGMCPVTERIDESELILFPTCQYAVGEDQRDQLVAAIRKVHAARGRLHALDDGFRSAP